MWGERSKQRRVEHKDMKRDLDLASDINLYDMYSEGLTFSDPDFTHSIPLARERVAKTLEAGVKATEMNLTKLRRVDDYVISNIDGLPGDFDEDDPNQPLEKWWWHLKAIKEGRFPRELLPVS